MSNNEDNRSQPPEKKPVEAGAKRPDSARPQRSQSSTNKSGPIIPPASSATNRRPQRQAEPAPAQPLTRRAASRYQKDLQRQRQLVIATAVVIGLIVLVLLVGVFQSLISPNIKTLAQVNGQSISSGDYYKFRKIQLFKEIGQLQQQLQYLQGDQVNQVQARIQLDQSELSNITNSPVDQTTLETMVSTFIAEQAAKDQFGITISDNDLNQFLNDQFLSIVYTPTPNPTDAAFTATAGAVNTAGATIATATASNITPLPTNTPSVSPTVTDTASTTPQVTGTPGTPAPTSSAAPSGTPGSLTPAATSSVAASGTVSGTLTASTTVTATATVTPTATATYTPLPGDKVQGTVSASRSSYLDAFKKATGLSEDDYKRWELRPQLVKKRVSERLLAQVPAVGSPYAQIKGSQILAKDEPTANDLLNQLKGVAADQLEAKFGQLARDKSEDKVSAAKNGDIGWFIEGQVADPLWKAAQGLNKGQLSQPIKTDSGYYILLITDKSQDRPLDPAEYNQLTTTDQNGDYVVYTKWLKDKVTAAKPTYQTSPTPTAPPTQIPAPVFTPVIEPTATATSAPTPSAAPTTPGSPAASGTPGATGTPSVATTAATTTAAATTSAAASTTTAATTVATTTAATTPAPSPTR